MKVARGIQYVNQEVTKWLDLLGDREGMSIDQGDTLIGQRIHSSSSERGQLAKHSKEFKSRDNL